ncbi:MAG: putative SCF ubiquitin ligase [Streblomastix strix]|uniref:Putative SCF ubiquitin ligase n=1 Tax=Streblomastix strix TaxID=222440 RepID=A0A5J4WYP7_9EUKA|nr:MAG: putative SCF ubiquitin ligase [Streblomastix strix]
MAEIKVTTEDSKTVLIKRELALMCGTIREGIIHSSSQDAIQLPNIREAELNKVIEYLEFHSHATNAEGVSPQEAKEFDNSFVRMEKSLLFAVVIAANYLDIKPLLDLTCAAIANNLKGKTPEEIRREYNIENDLTPEDEEEIKAESAWLYQ